MSNFVESVRLGLLKFILTCIHLVYSILLYFDVAWALFKRKLNRAQKQSEVENYISDFVSTLEKKPSHIVVILGTDTLTLADFCNLVIWSKAAGISYLTFYDHGGFIKEHSEIYYSHITRKRNVSPDQIIFGFENLPVKNGVEKNGMVNVPKTICLNFMSLEDGKPKIVKLVEKFSEKSLRKEFQSSELHEDYLNEELHTSVKVPDPEVAFVCGEAYSTYGLLPWQIRLTEFYHINTVKNITPSEFTALLKKYSDCDQRIGK